MKTILYILSFFIIHNAQAFNVFVEDFDQEKLADLVNRLPDSVKLKQVSRIKDPINGVLVRSVFPRQNLGFQAICESKFYHNSPYPSFSTCTLTVDDHHPLVLNKYDEFKVTFSDRAVVTALFESISFGKPNKDFRSFGKNEGTSFSGKRTWVFDYRFDCSTSACNVYFSEIRNRIHGRGETRNDRLF